MKRIFGQELVMDLHNCKLEIISDREAVREYLVALCELIDMVAYGEPQIPFFGSAKKHTEGFTMMQLIETSLISGHFSNYWKRAYINIFSCKDFDYKKAIAFTEKFFKGDAVRVALLQRR